MSDIKASVGDLFQAGNLTEAVAAAGDAVKRAPTDVAARILLAELLIFTGNLERADRILDAAGDFAPDAQVTIAEFRQLLRAETARLQLHQDGRVPSFLGEPTASQRALLAAHVALRAGDHAEAARHAETAEQTRPRITGHADDEAIDDFRDADDLTGGTLEVLTTTGKYFWIPAERITSALFHPPRRPRDLAWRRVTLAVNGGPEGDVYCPALYAGSPDATDAQRLGRETDWVDLGGLVRGVGQRSFLAGESLRPIMKLSALELSPLHSSEAALSPDRA